MRCPNCRDVDLVSRLATNGVMVDYCYKCGGVWLDKGEIYYFTKDPDNLYRKLVEATKHPRPSSRLNPHTHTPLVELTLPGGLVIDYCPDTEGIWLDKGELERLPQAKDVKINLSFEHRFKGKPASEVNIRLPSLGLVSGVTLFLLYAFITFILIGLVNFGFLSPSWALFLGVGFAIVQFLISPYIMDCSLRWFYHLQWVPPHELPSHLREFITKVALSHRIKFPRVGIIYDGSPNAFTYGHTPYNARIVITQGLMDLLQPEELEAVVGHELGHIVHWDILVMTIAYIVPMWFYYIYRVLMEIRPRRDDKSAPYRYSIAIFSYILYIVSEYIVLWLSRVREYFADRFSGEVTRSPDILASSLVKIAYGLAGRGKDTARNSRMESIKAMGVFDPAAGKALAVTTYRPASMGGEIDKNLLKGAMRWDLWNPWALYYELHSTHPLVAKRLLALSQQCRVYGKEPYIVFDERRPESYLDEFLVDLLISYLPVITISLAGIMAVAYESVLPVKLGIILTGLAYLGVISFSYRFDFFPAMNVASLLKKVKVSQVRPVPCTLKGKIIGRGVPGLIWSEDFVLQDDTGIIFLDYQQPLAIWNFLFGILKAAGYIDKEVTVKGWYRRAPVPYVEVKSITSDMGTTRCYVFNVKIAVAILMILAGVISLFF